MQISLSSFYILFSEVISNPTHFFPPLSFHLTIHFLATVSISSSTEQAQGPCAPQTAHKQYVYLLPLRGCSFFLISSSITRIFSQAQKGHGKHSGISNSFSMLLTPVRYIMQKLKRTTILKMGCFLTCIECQPS